MNPDLTPEQLDLLMALANEDLTGEELERARAVVDADPVLAAELALQVEAREHTRDLRASPMADFEAAAMRREVMATLESEGVVPALKAPRPRPWLTRLLPVAAVLGAVVMGVGFLSNLSPQGTSDQLESADMAAVAEAPAATESASVTQERAQEDSVAADAGMSAAMPESLLPDLGALSPNQVPAVDEESATQADDSLAAPKALSCDALLADGEAVDTYTELATGTWDGIDVTVIRLADGRIGILDPIPCSLLHVYDLGE